MFHSALDNFITSWPAIEQFFLEGLEAVFAPKATVRMLILGIVLQSALMVGHGTMSFLHGLFEGFTPSGRQKRKILTAMSNATNFASWRRAAQDLDKINGIDSWRSIDASPFYDHELLRKRIDDINALMNAGDTFNLMFKFRGGLARDQFGIQHEALFSRTCAGTKDLIEEYHETVSQALEFIADSPATEEVPTDAKLAFFNETRHAYGRSALLLSGGAYLGFYHVGLVDALFKDGVLPRVISGASAGSLICGIVGTRTDEELPNLINANEIRKDHFSFGWEKKEASSAKKFQALYYLPANWRWLGDRILSAVFENESLIKLDTDHLIEVAKENIGLYTFQEAFDRTGRIINITVAPTNNYDPPRLLNYLTAPHICVYSAAVASCAIPGVFDAVSLMVKEPDGTLRPEYEWSRGGHMSTHDISNTVANYSDGSIENDLPMQQLSELYNVNHFVVSQVNPHSALLSSLSVTATVWSNPIYGFLCGVLRFLKAQLRDWVGNIVDLAVYRSKAPTWSARRGLHQLLTQEYTGRESDITIMPWKGQLSLIEAFGQVIKNPTVEEYLEVIRVSAQNTFPYIPRIRAHCMVEMTLDRCVQGLRRKLALENMALTSEELDSKGKIGFLNRVPSFYTSRSIVNLSGLSVSDPQPVVISSGSDDVIAQLEKEDEENRAILAAIEADRKQPSVERGSTRRATLNRTHSRPSDGSFGIFVVIAPDVDLIFILFLGGGDSRAGSSTDLPPLDSSEGVSAKHLK